MEELAVPTAMRQVGIVLDSCPGDGCPWGCPYQPLSDGMTPGPLIPPAVSPPRVFPWVERDLSIPSSTEEEPYQLPAHRAGTGVRKFGTTRSIPIPAMPSLVTWRCVPCWSFGNRIHSVAQQHPRPHNPREGRGGWAGIRPGTPQNDADFRERRQGR